MSGELPKGFMSNVDIEVALDRDIVICDFDRGNLTDIGYNLTATEFIFSINRGLLVPIHNLNNEKFCYVDPHDTILILTREAVWVSENIAGTFHSKVRIVSQGFGHIGTTLDAYWEGPLLISLNNPTKKKLKFTIGRDDGNGFRHSSFVTLVFYRMASPTTKGHDNPPCRLDILKALVSKPKYINFYPDQYNSLERVIGVIADFESLQVGIGKAQQSDRAAKVKQFKEKYDSFARQIAFHISQAHEINDKIIRIKNVGYYLQLGIPLSILCYFAVRAWINNDSNTISLIAVLLSAYSLIAGKILFNARGDGQ